MDFSKLSAYLDSLGPDIGIPMVDCIVTYGHETVYRHQTGFVDREKTRAPGDDDWYRLFSLTKVMTAVASMQLLEQKKIHLYDPVSRYLPEYEVMKVFDETVMDRFVVGVPVAEDYLASQPTHYAHNPIRIIDLLSMTAGFSYSESTPSLEKMKKKTNYHATTRQMIRSLAETPLLFEPGTHWYYSLCLDAMAAVIEVVTGESFGEYLQNHVFGPLGANDMAFHPTPEQEAKIATQYGWLPDKGFVPLDSISMDFALGRITKPDPVTGEPVMGGYGFMDSDRVESGGGGLFGTLTSYSKVLEALANGGTGANGAQILKPESVKMFTVGVTAGQTQEDFRVRGNKGPYAYGLGVRVKNTMDEGRAPIGEFGWDGATGGLAMVDPINRISISYIHHVFWYRDCYRTIHPMVKDLVYEALDL